ncbi:tir-nbs-lrr resistance protein [Corchorus olitorius]|uniref:ubiquitinyl hydrolase 1 n=1 Tax=Corchorus olitorius TaxID=93759 RepID=A0A1R3H9X6_9ROSI|nr:tir-nbs-lrr resistance protein [Corchorus olitorius]
MAPFPFRVIPRKIVLFGTWALSWYASCQSKVSEMRNANRHSQEMACLCDIKLLNNILEYHQLFQHQEHETIRKEIAEKKVLSLHMSESTTASCLRFGHME